MAQFYVDSNGAFIRQEIVTAFSFLGQRTSHSAGRDKPTRINSRVIGYDRNPASGEGLFEFEPFLRDPNQGVYLTKLHILVGGGVAWSVFITDGDEVAGAPYVDTVAQDIEHSIGTGSAIVSLDMGLKPKAKLRVITSTVGSTFGMLQVEFFPILDKFERILN